MIARETIYGAVRCCRLLLVRSRHRADAIGTTCRSSSNRRCSEPAHTETLTTSPGGDRHWQFSLIALIYAYAGRQDDCP